MAGMTSEIDRICNHIVEVLTRRMRQMISAEFKRVFGPSFLGGKLKWSAVLAPTIITKTADWTLSAADTNTDDWVIVDATSGDITLTFPPVSDRARPYYIIKKDAAHNVTFAPDPTLGTDTFNGAASFTLSIQYGWAVVKPDTANGAWYVELPPVSGGGGGGTPVNARAHASAGADLPATDLTIINFDTVDFDSASAITTGGSWVYTVPVTGVYHVTWMLLVQGPDTTGNPYYMSAQLLQNGDAVDSLSYLPVLIPDSSPTMAGALIHGDDLVACTAGDTLTVAMGYTTADLTLIGSPYDNYITIALQN